MMTTFFNMLERKMFVNDDYVQSPVHSKNIIVVTVKSDDFDNNITC